MRFASGLTLIGLLIYVSSLVVILLVMVSFLSRLISFNTAHQVTGEVLDNARQALHVIAQEIRFASDIYQPTSSFGAHPGQLSLATTRDLPEDENITYVDFYVDDDLIYVKREGQAAQLLNSERMKVVSLAFTELNAEGPSPSIQVSLSLALDSPDPPIVTATTVSLTTTVALRAYNPAP